MSEPSFEMVEQMLINLRNQHPYPSTAVQFTGGEPTINPEYHRIVARTQELGFTHIKNATNGNTNANQAITIGRRPKWPRST